MKGEGVSCKPLDLLNESARNVHRKEAFVRCACGMLPHPRARHRDPAAPCPWRVRLLET